MGAVVNAFPEGQIIAFALVFLRIMSFVVVWPIFGGPNVPVHLKVLLAVVIAITLFPTVKFANADQIKIDDQMVFFAIRELVVGLFLGFLLKFFFFSVSIAGEIFGVSSGLSSAQLYNPLMGTQTNVMEQVHLALATLFLLAMNGHHLFIQGLAQSFETIPVGIMGFRHEGFASISMVVRDACVMGLQIASPIIVAVFIANLTMGLMGRAVPQLNVMMTGFQVTICVAFLVLFVSMPFFVGEMQGLMQMTAEKFFAAMKVI